ncbi:MAG TPA: glycosyltransferase family 2 protein [Bryobacteraceae bacterium]|jgi:glycosyltransferase involved in cell wall biosynthesis|nr:glycosyltransferase family 2 protein [Bryobacteraceae bacterium]
MLPLAVIVGIRANQAELDRQRNLRLCLETLKRQDLPCSEFQTILIEQDYAPQVSPEITGLADRYQFAYNAGPYNRGWAFNIGAKLVCAAAEYLLFLDADVLLQRHSLGRLLELLRGGSAAVRPYCEALFLDRESTARVAAGWPQLPASAGLNGAVFVNPMGLSIAVEAGLYERIGGHDERFRGWGWEDREFWERLEHYTDIGRLPDRILHLHHEHSQVKEVWAAANQALFFESLEHRRTVSEEASKGDIEKYRSEHRDDLAEQFPDARILVHGHNGTPEFHDNGDRRWFSCSIAKGPGVYTGVAVFLSLDAFSPVIYNSARPLISVVMPTYYRLHTLLTAVDSLRAQTYPHWELILVDNAGDSNYYFADARIRVFADAAERGAAYARNSGITRATGDFVCFFDDDDIMYPHYLERLVSAFIAHPDAGMVRCGIRKPDGWDSFSYATPACCLRGAFATPTWIPEHGQDQTYFKTIAQQHGWSVENGKIVVLGEVLCAAGFDMRGGLRRGDL